MKYVLLALFSMFLLFSLPACAQWREATGPLGVGHVALAIDPLDADSIWIGGSVLFHSSDGGKTYERVKGFPNSIHRPQIDSIAISRDKDGPIIVKLNGFLMVTSDDRGKTWRKTVIGKEVGYFSDVQAGPAGSKVFHGTCHDGLIRSSDNGQTWEKRAQCEGESRPVFLIADRYNADTFFWLVQDKRDVKVLFSRDGGKTSKVVQLPKDEKYLVSASTDPDDEELLYICCMESGWRGGQSKRYYYTYDDGETWEVYWDSRNGGKMPEAIEKKLRLVMPDTVVSPLPDFHQTMPERSLLAWSENKPGRVIAWSDGVVMSSDDFGKTWEHRGKGLAGTVIKSIVIDPSDPESAFCTHARRVLHTSDGGNTWTEGPPDDGWYPNYLCYSPDGKSVFVVAYGIWKGTRDGQKWEKVWEPKDYRHRVSCMFFRKSDEADGAWTAFAVGDGFLLRSTDGGDTWEQVCETEFKVEASYEPIKVLQIERDGKEAWYIRRHGATRSDDQGHTWAEAGQDFLPSPEDWSVGSDGSVWWISSRSLVVGGDKQQQTKLDRKRSDGETIFAKALVRDPVDTKVGYVGLSDGRLFRTTDGGKTLVELEGGPTGVQILSLAISPKGDTLWVGTDGNGVWILENPKEQPAAGNE